MEAVIKRKKKRLVKVLTRLYYILVVVGIILFVFLLSTIRVMSENHATIVKEYSTIGIITMMTFIMLGCIAGVFAQTNGCDLSIYKRKIKHYRACTHFNLVIKLLKEKEYSKAIDLYNSMNDSGVKDSLYPYMLGVLANCDDPIRVKNANKSIEKMLNEFNPDTVFN